MSPMLDEIIRASSTVQLLSMLASQDLRRKEWADFHYYTNPDNTLAYTSSTDSDMIGRISEELASRINADRYPSRT